VDNERPAPPITIVDPRGAVLTTDLLGSGNEKDPWEPWQPTLLQVAILLVVVLVTAVVSVPVLLVHNHSRDRALDRKELQSLSLTQPEQPNLEVTGTADTIGLTLQNDGPSAVRVLSAHVDRTGYQDQRVSATVRPGGTAIVELRPLGDCPPPRALPASPSGVVVRVRTARGQLTTVRVSVRDSSFSYSYSQAIALRCGALPVQDAFLAEVRDVQTSPTSVSGHLRVRNRSRDPHTLSSLLVGDGFRLVLGRLPPIAVPPGPDALDVDIPFTITVTTCRVAKQQMSAGTDPERDTSDYSFEQPSFGGLNATSSDTSDGPFPLLTTDRLVEPLATLVTRTCGDSSS
jgi:hypothetical protein